MYLGELMPLRTWQMVLMGVQRLTSLGYKFTFFEWVSLHPYKLDMANLRTLQHLFMALPA